MKIVTHDGPFHADDVFGAALLKELFPEAILLRSRSAKVMNNADIVFDVGRVYDKDHGRFDHHMVGARQRANGIPYSAFGLLWDAYGLRYCDMDQAVFERVDSQLVESVDADDNGYTLEQPVVPYVIRPTLDTIVRSFNPIGGETYDEQFDEAVGIASLILRRAKKSAQKYLAMYEMVLESYDYSSLKDILILDYYVPVHELRNLPIELKYIISREHSGRWLLCAVQDTDGFDSLRQPLPLAWAGLSGVELESITGLRGVQSCHKNRFVAVCGTQTSAFMLAKLALD